MASLGAAERVRRAPEMGEQVAFCYVIATFGGLPSGLFCWRGGRVVAVRLHGTVLWAVGRSCLIDP